MIKIFGIGGFNLRENKFGYSPARGGGEREFNLVDLGKSRSSFSAKSGNFSVVKPEIQQ